MAFNELVLPQKIQLEEKTATDFYGKFIAEPYESGYGHTVGNSLRRILLSGMEGAAVSAVRIAGAVHEFSTIPNVREDVINILLNFKHLRIKMEGKTREYLQLHASKPGVVTAADIEEIDGVEIINKDLVIATLEVGGTLDIEIEVSRGRIRQGTTPGRVYSGRCALFADCQSSLRRRTGSCRTENRLRPFDFGNHHGWYAYSGPCASPRRGALVWLVAHLHH